MGELVILFTTLLWLIWLSHRFTKASKALPIGLVPDFLNSSFTLLISQALGILNLGLFLLGMFFPRDRYLLPKKMPQGQRLHENSLIINTIGFWLLDKYLLHKYADRAVSHVCWHWNRCCAGIDCILTITPEAFLIGKEIKALRN